jgi:Chitobiase/beta-hexosaminidase C-terminal domain
MRKCLFLFSFFIIQSGQGQPVFQLAPPMLNYSSTFLSQASVQLSIVFNQPGAEVRYTLNGKEPTEKDRLYTRPFTINGERVIVKAKAIGKNFLPSETIKAEFVKGGKAVKEITFTPPHESYAKAGPNILHDDIGGLTNYGNGTWLGYDKDTVEINIQLTKKETVNKVLLDMLQDENSWIFLPEKISLYYYADNQKTYLPLGVQSIGHDQPGPKQCSIREIIPTKKVKTDRLKLVFETVRKIPEWHAGKGNHGWFFIDEIKVY